MQITMTKITKNHSWLFDKTKIMHGLKTFGITFLIIGTLNEYVHFVQSPTDSMLKHYFIQFTQITPEKGDITMAYSDIVQGNVIKQIIGTAGDKILIDKAGNITVGSSLNKSFKVGKAFKKSKDGLTLTSAKAMIIPKDYVFLFAPHPRSFDSRYLEFGLVHKSRLQGKLVAIC
jgi:conjugal transfer pilin signal peptidase TrbI